MYNQNWMITTTMMPFAETICIVLFMWVFPRSPFIISIESILRLYNQITSLILHRWTYKSHISSKYWSFYFIRIIVTMFIPYNPVQQNKLTQSIFVCWNSIHMNRAPTLQLLKTNPFCFYSRFSFYLFGNYMSDISNISNILILCANLVSGNCLSNNFYFIIFYSHFSSNIQSFILVFPIHYSNSIVSL